MYGNHEQMLIDRKKTGNGDIEVGFKRNGVDKVFYWVGKGNADQTKKSIEKQGYKLANSTPIKEASFPGRASNGKLENIDGALQVIYPYMSKGDQALKDKTFHAYYRFYNDGDFNSLPFPFLKSLGMPENEIRRMKDIKSDDTWSRQDAFRQGGRRDQQDSRRKNFYAVQKMNSERYAPFLEKGLELIMKYFIKKYKPTYLEHKDEVMAALRGKKENVQELFARDGDRDGSRERTGSYDFDNSMGSLETKLRKTNPEAWSKFEKESGQFWEEIEAEDWSHVYRIDHKKAYEWKNKLEDLTGGGDSEDLDENEDYDPKIFNNRVSKESESSYNKDVKGALKRLKAKLSPEGWQILVKFIKGHAEGGYNRPEMILSLSKPGKSFTKTQLRSYGNTILFGLIETGDLIKGEDGKYSFKSNQSIKEDNGGYDKNLDIIRKSTFKQLQDLIDQSNPSGTDDDRYEDSDVAEANKKLFNIGFYTSDDGYGEIEDNLDSVTKTRDGKTLKDLGEWFEESRM